jgi:transposase InsO family protein
MRWLRDQNVGPVFIAPGSPWQNGYVQSFNGKLRDECLNPRMVPRHQRRSSRTESRSASRPSDHKIGEQVTTASDHSQLVSLLQHHRGMTQGTLRWEGDAPRFSLNRAGPIGHRIHEIQLPVS